MHTLESKAVGACYENRQKSARRKDSRLELNVDAVQCGFMAGRGASRQCLINHRANRVNIRGIVLE